MRISAGLSGKPGDIRPTFFALLGFVLTFGRLEIFAAQMNVGGEAPSSLVPRTKRKSPNSKIGIGSSE